MVKMSSENNENTESLQRFNIDGIPLITSIVERLGLRTIISDYIAPYGNETVPAVDTLMLLLCNITLGRQPLYELEQWVQRIDPKCHGLRIQPHGSYNDDRFGRALDKLYLADRASLMTEIVMKMIRVVGLDL
ncbi:unnamed protein product, partial [marine sediment metagenome]